MKMNKQVVREFYKYLFSGGLAFLLNYGTFLFLYRSLSVHYLWAAGLGEASGILLAYYLSVKIVFKHRQVDNKKVELIIFTAVGLVGIVINEVAMYLMVDKLVLKAEVAKLLTTGLVLLWNFTVRKYLLFRS